MSGLSLSLQITLIGMGLVFGAILVLWGMMVLLTALIREPKETPAEVSQPAEKAEAPSALVGLKARAAAAAVALALAEQSTSTAHPLTVPPPVLVSAWQLGMRTRQMTQKGSSQKKEKR